ncbi:TonB-dependent receptor [Sphingomonas alpina]|uniref:TonB-dependent receptor n=1 Tax=Sphingomonas alpina TaxID=653931 RepID=A0A7H0LJD1_9SPHN|nr:TonB-dependent receptor [Sphingomonas alpina]QNQ09784.1 TonB-dependent receptor [Sphingomonas alpina]
MTNIRKMLGATTALSLFLIAAPAIAQQGPATGDTTREPDNDDIIVTAQKREQTLFEIPQSISVLGGDTLDRQKATSFVDYAALVPGLTIQQSNPGEARVVLRGINTGSVGSTVGIYVDETPFGSSSSLGNAAVLAGDFDTFDLARVEVLRGPQGTLYGANSLGGVLKFVTNAPKLDTFEVRGQAGVETIDDGGTGYLGNAVINVPLGKTLALRASGFYRKNAGFIDATGRAGENINDSEAYGGRASLLFQPVDELSVRLTAVAQNIRANSPSSFDADPLTSRPLTVGRMTRAESYPDSSKVDYRLYNGTLNYDFGVANLTSVTSYGILDQRRVIDNTVVLGDTVSGVYAAFANVTTPLGIVLQADIKQKKFTQELRLASADSDSFEWLIGGYYTRETVNLFQRYAPFVLGSKAFIDPKLTVGGTDFREFLTASLDSVYKEYAAFGSATWHVSSRFDITAGGRYSHNDQRSVQIQDGAYLPLVGIPFIPFISSGKSKENVFTWSVSPRFELNDHASIYARVAKGYRPGGPNVVPPGSGPDFPVTFKADTLISYEAGIRAETADRTFGIDASVYYLDWKDILVFGAFDSAVGQIGANDNGKKARSYGAEVTATIRPTAGFTVVLNTAYNDANLTDDTPAVTGGFDGDRLPFSPKWNANLSADYEWRLSGSARAFVGGNIRLIGDQAADFDTGYRAAFGRRLQLDGYQTVDLRAGVDFGSFTVTAYAKNLTNERGFNNLAGFGTRPGTAVAASPIRPRTVGATLGFSF